MVAQRTVRPTKEQLDGEILDITAGLIARRGIKDTAVQAVADATGYSKTGILNRFPSKDVLVDSAIRQCVQLARAAHASMDTVREPRTRDAAALVALTDLALERRGWIEIVLASLPPRRDDDLAERLTEIGEIVSAMFTVSDGAATPLERQVRVAGSLGALVVLTATYEDGLPVEKARPFILMTCWGALGYGSPFPA